MSEHCPTWCSCATCADRKVAAADRLAPARVHELEVALQRLVDVVDRIWGYLDSADQAALWRARQLAKGAQR